MKRITFIVDKKGAVKLEASGFVGDACALKTKKFMDALGSVVGEEKKPEFFEFTDQCLEKQ